MQCSEAIDLLVAFADQELSPSARRLVDEHVRRCPSCAALHDSLLAVTPEPFLHPSTAVLDELYDATDPGRVLAAAARPPASSPHMWRWLAGDAQVPRSMVAGYGLLLAATFAWGLANWYTAASMTQPGSAVVAPTPASEIPPNQYQPASYRPSEAAYP